MSAERREGRARSTRLPQRGQAIAEMAIIVPVLLLLVFGIIEMSNAWRAHQVVTNLAREGARLAILPTAVEDDVRAAIAAGMAANGYAADTIVIQCNGADGICSGTGQETSVRVEMPFTFRLLGPIVALACGDSCGSRFGSITIASTTVMRKE